MEADERDAGDWGAVTAFIAIGVVFVILAVS